MCFTSFSLSFKDASVFEFFILSLFFSYSYSFVFTAVEDTCRTTWLFVCLHKLGKYEALQVVTFLNLMLLVMIGVYFLIYNYLVYLIDPLQVLPLTGSAVGGLASSVSHSTDLLPNRFSSECEPVMSLV